ncbi:hypothetical protein E8E14_000951 [Neopestalotiopsis sp. 37M]|nr:hypothetical protein E8E14_000951 [Neopestalotiopsis sp. 37M]
MVILPGSAVEEVRNLPREVANPTIAHAHNLLGKYTRMDLILRSDLHFRMIQTKLTPSLGSLTGPMEEEIKWAMKAFPDLFVTVVAMRLLPTWTHPVLAWLLPSNWRSAGYIKRAQKIFVPEIERRRKLMAEGKLDKETSETLLSWMIQCAQGEEQDARHLAHLEIVISLAAIHTSQMNAVHVLYDLAARPHHIAELRDEIRAVVAAKQGRWDKTSYAQLRKLDSFMKESQRFNPPSVLSYHRVMTQAYRMDDGTYLPRGTHIAMPVQAIQNDPALIENPDVFDGFRYYRRRQDPAQTHLHQFATTEKTQLNFGHGRAACPGRFFASLEIKCILVHLIMNYDFKLAGKERPSNLRAHEFIFPNPDGELLVREREVAESPF